MTQLFLDPETKSSTGMWKAKVPLPPKVREFGHVPNPKDLQPGDLLLFHKPNKRSMASNLIIEAQNSSYDAEHARWHHAAVYVGDGYLCEASVISGVRYRPLHEYFLNHWIRVRRDPEMTENQGWNLAVRSLTRLKEGYGFSQILRLGAMALKGFMHPSKLLLDSKGVICSQLYHLAYMAVNEGKVLFFTEGRSIVPAELSITDKLQDAHVTWLAISKN